MRRSLLVAWVVLAGCHRSSAPLPEPGGLAGKTLPLMPSPALRLSVLGSLGGKPVPVQLDVDRPLSLVSPACFEGSPPRPEGQVRAPEPGGMKDWAMVPLPGLRVGGVSVPGLSAGLTGEKGCAVTLGSDVLAPYALTVEPLRREVTFALSRSREAYAAELTAPGADPSLETHLLELSREPTGDWPLLAARVVQGQAQLTGPFVLATRESFSRLAVKPAESQGLRTLELAAGVPARVLPVDSVEVAQGVGVSPLVFETGPWTSASSLGRLGPDVWGHFRATLDVQAGVLLLRRPRVLASGARQRCAQSGTEGFDDESCYGLHTRREADGTLTLSVTVYRDLPEGGRLHVEPLGEDGKPLRTGCGVGFTFIPGSRGVTTQHRLPWPSLAQAMPECAVQLSAARGYALALFEEGRLPECPLTCAFVRETATRPPVCECQETPLGEGLSAVPRKPGPSQPPPKEERQREPEDPK